MSVSSKSRSGSVRSRRDRLKTYLATGLGACGVATSAEAAVVSININSPDISGVNAGLPSGGLRYISAWPIANSANSVLLIANGYGGFSGLTGSGNLGFAINGGSVSPRNFSTGSLIDSSATWSQSYYATAFKGGPFVSPSFGLNSFMGLRFSTNSSGDYYYGWLEVTWNGTDTFQIYAAAYESTVNTAIKAGDTGAAPAPVPEPASGAVVALLMGGTALRQWRKKRRENDAANSDSLAS
jgi:hypothetical protein